MIHIVDYFNSDVRHMRHWQTVVRKSLINAGHEVNIIEGTNSNLALASLGLLGDIFYKTTQFENIYEEFIAEGVSQGDIFIFTDAWNPTVISVKYISEIMGMDLHTIGLWRDGIYDVNSKIRTGLLRRPKDWAKTVERALYKVYDVNCFITPIQKKRFLTRYGLKDSDTSIVTGLPYSGVRMIKDTLPIVEKEDIIVLPHDAIDAEQRDIFKALRNYLKGYTFVDAHELRLTDGEYYSLLNRAKAVLAINLSETDPTHIYEALMFECVPIIPDRLIYKDVFPERYQYPSSYTHPPFLNFVRGREYMHERVKMAIDNYDTYVPHMREDFLDIENKFFNTNHFIQVINSLTK